MILDLTKYFTLKDLAGYSNVDILPIDFTNSVMQPVSVGDDLKVVKVPRLILLEKVHVYHAVSAGGTCTIDIGTAQNGTQITSNLSLNTTGLSAELLSGTSIAVAAGSFIWINADHTNAAAKFHLILQYSFIEPTQPIVPL